MGFLLLSIACSVSIFSLFKVIARVAVSPFPVIIINYAVAVVVGLILYREPITLSGIYGEPWFKGALLIGTVFIFMFLIIGYSTLKVGIAITSVASKMSVVIPAIFSLLYYQEILKFLQIPGMVFSFVALILILYKKGKQPFASQYFLLPLIIFIGTGIIDILVKIQQASHLNYSNLLIFNVVVFATAFMIGMIMLLFRSSQWRKWCRSKVVISGIILGLANFGSLYFMVMTLESEFLPSSVIFTINNIAIVTLSVMVAGLFFKERISRTAWIGFILAAVGMLLLGI